LGIDTIPRLTLERIGGGGPKALQCATRATWCDVFCDSALGVLFVAIASR